MCRLSAIVCFRDEVLVFKTARKIKALAKAVFIGTDHNDGNMLNYLVEKIYEN